MRSLVLLALLAGCGDKGVGGYDVRYYELGSASFSLPAGLERL